MRTNQAWLLAGLALLGAPVPGQGKAAAPAGPKAILAAQAPRIVSLRVVLEIEYQNRKQEIRLNARGVLVGAAGLVLTAQEVFEPNLNIQGRAIDADLTPKDVKVVVGNEEKEHEAFLSGKDTKLGLAFVQISDVADQKLPFLDLGKAADLEVGDDVVTINRLDKGFDYAPHFLVSTVTGELKKPRKAHLVDRASGIGLPVFNLKGELVGFHARLEAGVAEGGGRPPTNHVILPAKVVAGVAKSAEKQAQELLAERKAKGAESKGEEKGAEDEVLPGDTKKK